MVPKTLRLVKRERELGNRGHLRTHSNCTPWRCTTYTARVQRIKGVYMKIKVIYKGSKNNGQLDMVRRNGKLMNCGGRICPF